jgi:DNA-binding SARP family transcriptional activator/TolB-like protein/tetratricopeptide (TPR) repeat protein
MLRLRTLGGLALESERGDSSAPLGQRPLAVLAMLAASSERGIRREKVIAMLWPESDEERARNSLSQALTAVRRLAGADAIVAGTVELQLNADVVSSDVRDFEAAVGLADFRSAVSLYGGSFLDGVHVRSAPGFDEWVEHHRTRLHRLQAEAIEQLARAADRRDDRKDAVVWWRRLTGLEPTSARATLGLMKALAADGEHAAALQHFRVYETLIRQEVGAEPDSTVTALAAQFRQTGAYAGDTSGSVTGSARRPDEGLPGIGAAPVSSMPGAVPQPRRGPRDLAMARWVTLGSIVTILGMSVFAMRADRTRQAVEPRIAVVPFRNLTGDSTLDRLGFLTAEHIVDGLQRVGMGNVTDPITAPYVTAELRSAAAPVADSAEVERVGDATKAGLVVSGTYARDGDSIVVVARLTDATRRTLIGVTEPVRMAPTSPTLGLDHVRQRALGMLALRGDRTLHDVLPIGSSSPPTLAAYTEYLEGLQRFQQRATDESVPFFARAYALDSTFVAPLIWQAFAAGQEAAGAPQRRRAVRELARHRGRLGPLDRQALAYFEASERGDIPGQVNALRLASAMAPGSVWTYNLGNLMNGLGRNDEAVAAFDQIDLNDGWLRYWPGLWRPYARSLHYVDHERELRIVREARTILSERAKGDRGAWVMGLRLDEARALAALGRRPELEKVLAEVESARDPTRFAGGVLMQAAMELWSRGDTAYARDVLNRALAWYAALPPTEAATRPVRRNYAEALYHADQWSRARALFETLAREDPDDWQARAFIGLCAARQRDVSAAMESIAALESKRDSIPEMNLVVGSRLVFLARIAAVLGERDRAIGYIRALNDRTGGRLSRHAQHRDFESLAGHPLYEQATRPP